MGPATDFVSFLSCLEDGRLLQHSFLFWSSLFLETAELTAHSNCFFSTAGDCSVFDLLTFFRSSTDFSNLGFETDVVRSSSAHISSPPPPSLIDRGHQALAAGKFLGLQAVLAGTTQPVEDKHRLLPIVS